MRLEIKTAWVFWTKWIWLEAWKPSVRLLKQSSLVRWTAVVACLIGLSGFLAFKGYAKTADRAEWFLWNNLVGALIIFIVVFAINWLVAPGRLLARDITRELICQWLTVINEKVGEGGRLIEEIRLGQDITAAQQECWRESTRRFFVENCPRYESIFDDIELGPLGPMLDLPARLRANTPLGLRMESPMENQRETLIGMISRRRANLRRIYEGLLPTSICGGFQ